MDKSTRMSKIRARERDKQTLLEKAEEALKKAEDMRDERFGDGEMASFAKEAAEGLNLASLDELRSMKMQPPPVVEIVARCVCTLASGDDLGDAEYRAREKAREAAAKKAAQVASAKGMAPPKPPQTVRRRLLSWEESQRVLSRANFKDRVANFDGRLLLDNDDLVAEVRARVDLSAIKPELSMAENLKPPVRSQKERNAEAANAQHRREGYAEAIASGAMASAPLVTIEDARYVSKIAPPLLVWVARILAQHDILDPRWRKVTGEVRAAAKKRDEAKKQVIIARKKVEEAKLDEAKKREKAKEEKARAEALGLQIQEEEEKKRTQKDDRPTELTTPDRIVVSGPTPNIFFQNGRISGIAGPGAEGGWLSPRLQLPTSIRFFIRVKHCRVSYPFPPSVPVDKYLLTAQVIPGHEQAGPVAHVLFDPQHVIGLHEHQLLSFVQLVIEVPSTETVNPGIHPTRLSFHPRHGAQLHSCGMGGAGTIEMPRLIVTVYPLLISRAAGRAASAPGSRSGSPEASQVASPLGRTKRSGRFEQAPDAASPGSPMGGDGAVPSLAMDVVRSIGSAYRSSGKMVYHGEKRGAESSSFGDADWARAAIALTERARSRPFALSRPGPTRQIPDILLQNSAVSMASAKRLSRSSARLGVESLKELSALVLRACEGYVLSKAEKRQLARAARLESEVEEADRVAEEADKKETDNPLAESAITLAIKEAERKAEAEVVARSAAEAQQQQQQKQKQKLPTKPAAAAVGSAAAPVTSTAPLAKPVAQASASTAAPEATAALAEAEAAARAANLPDAAAFGALFGNSVAHAATVAAHAAVAGAPAAAVAAQDAFASAVESAAKSAGVPAAAPEATLKSHGKLASPRRSTGKSPRSKASAPPTSSSATSGSKSARSPKAAGGKAAAAPQQQAKVVPPLSIPAGAPAEAQGGGGEASRS